MILKEKFLVPGVNIKTGLVVDVGRVYELFTSSFILLKQWI
jgi:hypothetical protein